MNTLISGDGFAGGGGWTIAAKAAGMEPAWAVEYDEAIADHHAAQLGGNVVNKRIQDVDPRKLERPWILTLSPVCKEFSLANSDGEEGEEEISQAEAMCLFIHILRPKGILIENVMGYRKSRSIKMVRATLAECGYWWDENILNSADYGVPQTRKRFILRAVQGNSLPPLPSPLPWQGWFSAIDDLIPSLPESQFAPWQLARLPEQLGGSVLTDSCINTIRQGTGLSPDEPAFTIKATAMRRHVTTPKAFLIDGRNTRTTHGKQATVRVAQSPCFTVTASDGAERHRAFLPDVAPSQGSLFPEIAFLIDGQNAGRSSGRLGICPAATPSFTVTASPCCPSLPRALLVDNVNSGPEARPNPRLDIDPAMTITTQQTPKAFLVNDQYANPNTDPERRLCLRSGNEPAPTIMGSEKMRVRAWLEQGKVVSMTPRALARFQSWPDWYQLPAKSGLACTIIGNGVAVTMATRLIEGMLEAIG